MLFMNIYKWEPGQRDALINRRMEKGIALSKGVKKVGEWFDVSGGRGFMLCETNDPKALMTSVMVWSDLMKQEIVTLLDPTEIFPAEKGKGSKK
jgi:hypothetical protein